MPISIVALLLSGLLLVSSGAYGQSTTPPDRLSGSAGIYAGHLRSSETTASSGTWIDIAFVGWELGTIELDVSRSRTKARRGESCPYDDCSPRYRTGSDGKPELISDPAKVVSPGLNSERYRAVSMAGLRAFGKSRHAAPHFLIGVARISRQVSFAYDDPAFGGQTWRRTGWGPFAGIGLDVFAYHFVVRIQYRLDPILVGEECFPVCNQQARVGVGWRF